jgi:glutamate decarboxylase
VVVRNGLSMDLAQLFIHDLQRSVEYLDGLSGPLPKEIGKTASGFHH